MLHTSFALRLSTGAALLAAVACSTDSATGPVAVRQGDLAAAITPGLSTAPVLYDQTLTDNGITSPKSGDNNVRMGDDFTVPTGQSWTVGQIMIAGRLNVGYTELPVAIHADADGKPGTVLASATLVPSNSVPSPCCNLLFEYLFELPSTVTLPAGKYWLVAEVTAAGVSRFDWHAPQTRLFGAAPLAAPDGDASWSNYNLYNDLGFAILGVPGSVQSQVITFPAIMPEPAIIGATVALSATASSGLPVTYSVVSGSESICAVSGSTLTFTGVGTCAVAADQAGNGAYLAAQQVSRSAKVNYDFSGFAAPVENDVPNAAKAGQAIPLRWRLTDANGAPITDLTVAKVSVSSLSCNLGSSADQLEEYAAGGSGLQNLGNGYYQLNWKSPSSYARSCKTMTLDLGEGSATRTASFHFTK